MKRAKQRTYPEITLDINKLSHDGRGVSHIDGKTTFVHGAIAGEKVICKVTYQHRRYNEGKVIDVITPAPERTTPACAHFGTCGGCSMQHIEMESQIKFKQNALLEQLTHFGNVTPEIILPPITGKPWGYRGKARLGVRYVIKKNKLLVGFREKLSNYLAEIEHCPVLHPSISIADLSKLITGLSQYEHIPQVEVAVGDDITALIFRHLQPLPAEDIQQLIDFGKSSGLHIFLQPNPPEKTHKIYPDQNEKLSYCLPDFEITMQFHPLVFTQVNSEINLLMIKQAIQLLDPNANERILDLFCGIGNFTLPIARFAKQVIGIEGSQEMVKYAEENAQFNHINNTQFYAANLMKPCENDAWMNQQYDKILLDPPRSGAKEIIPYFSKFAAKKVVYVSCNPSTLARDAGELVKLGYRLKKVGIINMFPHTSHIETIALFEK